MNTKIGLSIVAVAFMITGCGSNFYHQLMQKGHQSLDERNYSQAIFYFQSALQQNPHSQEAKAELKIAEKDAKSPGPLLLTPGSTVISSVSSIPIYLSAVWTSNPAQENLLSLKKQLMQINQERKKGQYSKAKNVAQKAVPILKNIILQNQLLQIQLPKLQSIQNILIYSEEDELAVLKDSIIFFQHPSSNNQLVLTKSIELTNTDSLSYNTALAKYLVQNHIHTSSSIQNDQIIFYAPQD